MHPLDSLLRRFALLLLAVALATLVAPVHAQLNSNGGSATGTLSDTHTVAVYSYTLATDADATLTLTVDGGLNAYVEFYDSDGTSNLFQNYISAGTTGTLTVPHLAPGATYYVHIERYNGAGSYTISSTRAQPAVANDGETDDAPTQAHPLAANGSVTGHLGYSRTAYNDVDTADWYKFVMPQDGDATFTLTNDSTINSYIEFYDSDGASEISQTYVSAGTAGMLTVPHLAPGATYYVLIARYAGYGGYSVAASITSPSVDNDAEPNDTAAQALPFDVNSTVTGHLGYPRTSYGAIDTSDWYTFIAPRDGDVTFTLTNDSTLNSYVEFYDSDGTGEISQTYVSAGTAGTLNVPHLAPGATYYVYIQRYSGYGGYTLSNGFAPLFVTNDVEVNDTASQAIPLASLNNIPGHLGYSRTAFSDIDTADWYSVHLPAGNFAASISISSPLTAYFSLVAPDGTSTMAQIYNGGGNAQLTYNIPAAGTYYLLVSRYSGYGAYDLNQPITATISGVISLEGIVPGAAAQNITVEFRPASGGTPFVRTVSVGYNGAYFITNVPRDKYTIAFKGAKWLRKVVQNIDVNVGDASGVNVLLPAGDATNDNRVDIGDFGLLVNVYGDVYDPADPNAPAADIAADFNCDGTVDIGDFGLMVNNYALTGDL